MSENNNFLSFNKSKKITKGSNLDDFVESGFFYYSVESEILNTPDGQSSTWGRLIVIEQDNNLTQQILISFGNLYYRQKLENSEWSAWINLTSGVEAYVLPKASETELGGIKVGRGLSIDEDGVLTPDSIELPIAKSNSLGVVKVGKNLSISPTGILSANDQTISAATSTKLGGIKVGENLDIDENGVLSAIVETPEEYKLPIASDTTLGGVKIGENLDIDEDGTLSIKIKEPVISIATKEKLGNVKIGKNINISDDGEISVNKSEEYKLPIASKDKLGGVMVGENLNISKNGVLSSVKYKLPKASFENLGGVKLSDDFIINEDGVLSLANKNFSLDNSPIEETPVGFEYKVKGELYFFNYDIQDQLNFINKATICIMYQSNILSGGTEDISLKALKDGKEVNLTLTPTEFLDLYINGAQNYEK